uniref:Uncharacterized protein n=1 Tax=Nelumbo nucifera TaxID=4432 RepID=A0A822XA31_NELNU|nr:TPA_asm: hypothetical protein HUJ06_019777 [Nelumbo nucifera]
MKPSTDCQHKDNQRPSMKSYSRNRYMYSKPYPNLLGSATRLHKSCFRVEYIQ